MDRAVFRRIVPKLITVLPAAATFVASVLLASAASATAVSDWNNAALAEVRLSKALRNGPPMVARALAIAHTCMYDAWAAYDPVAVGTVLGGNPRRPPAERTDANELRTRRAGIPAVPTTLSFATFSDAANQAGLSRLYGGIHFSDDNTSGQAIGLLIAQQAWARAQMLFNGTTP